MIALPLLYKLRHQWGNFGAKSTLACMQLTLRHIYSLTFYAELVKVSSTKLIIDYITMVLYQAKFGCCKTRY